jgi:hypothetical protein
LHVHFGKLIAEAIVVMVAGICVGILQFKEPEHLVGRDYSL